MEDKDKSEVKQGDKVKLEDKVTVRLPRELLNILEGESKFLKITLSAHIRWILGKYLEGFM